MSNMIRNESVFIIIKELLMLLGTVILPHPRSQQSPRHLQTSRKTMTSSISEVVPS